MENNIRQACAALLLFCSLPFAAASAQEDREYEIDSLQRVVSDMQQQHRLDSLQNIIESVQRREAALEALEADRQIWKKRSKYFYFGYNKSTLEGDNFGKLKSDWGASINWGKTFYVNKKAIAGMIKFGIDWTFLDLSFTKYTKNVLYYDGEKAGTEKVSTNQMDFGMALGPSVTVNPIHHLKAAAYFHVTPTYSAILEGGFDDFYGSYVTMKNAGFLVSWKVLSIGLEYRWGKAKYKDFEIMGFDVDDYDDELLETGDIDINEELVKNVGNSKFKTGMLRLYFGFRFSKDRQ